MPCVERNSQAGNPSSIISVWDPYVALQDEIAGGCSTPFMRDISGSNSGSSFDLPSSTSKPRRAAAFSQYLRKFIANPLGRNLPNFSAQVFEWLRNVASSIAIAKLRAASVRRAAMRSLSLAKTRV